MQRRALAPFQALLTVLFGSVSLLHLNAAAPSAKDAAADVLNPEFTPAENASFERGGNTYYQLCHACHGEDGRGAPILGDRYGRRMAPPLSGSPRVLARPEYVITALLTGIVGPVDGQTYEGLMVSMQSYGDAWIADVASYVRGSFDNNASMITSNQVARVRQRLNGRLDPLTIAAIESTLPVIVTNQAAWKLSASNNQDAVPKAADDNPATFWSAGIAQKVGIWFQIELPRPITFWDLNFESPPGSSLATTGFPRGFEVKVSDDGKTWSAPVARGTGRGAFTMISLKPTTARLIRVTLDRDSPDAAPWTICRTQILAAGPTVSALATPRVVNPFE